MAARNSHQIGSEIEDMKKKLQELEEQYKKAQEEEFDASVKRFMALFLEKLDIRTKEDMEKVTAILEDAEGIEKREDIEPVKENIFEEEPEPQEDFSSDKEEDDIFADIFRKDEEDKPQEEEPAEDEFKEEESDAAEGEWDDFWAKISAGAGIEEEESTENAAEDTDGSAEPEKEASPFYDLDIIRGMIPDDSKVASYKKSGSVAEAEEALITAINEAIKEGWVKKSEVYEVFFDGAEFHPGEKDFYSEMESIMDNVVSTIDEYGGEASKAAVHDGFADKFPYNIKGKGAAAAILDILAYTD